jgi:hypothetical protein
VRHAARHPCGGPLNADDSSGMRASVSVHGQPCDWQWPWQWQRRSTDSSAGCPSGSLRSCCTTLEASRRPLLRCTRTRYALLRDCSPPPHPLRDRAHPRRI